MREGERRTWLWRPKGERVLTAGEMPRHGSWIHAIRSTAARDENMKMTMRSMPKRGPRLSQTACVLNLCISPPPPPLQGCRAAVIILCLHTKKQPGTLMQIPYTTGYNRHHRYILL